MTGQVCFGFGFEMDELEMCASKVRANSEGRRLEISWHVIGI